MDFRTISKVQGARSVLAGLAASSLMLAGGASIDPAQAQSTETVLHSFADSGKALAGGYLPNGPLIMDASGALYGIAYLGGAGQGGVVYKLTPPDWTETVLHSFDVSGPGPAGGLGPNPELIMDAHGALYGTTFAGGSNQAGVVFTLTPPRPPSLKWIETVLYEFTETGPGFANGARPNGGVIMDAKGALYGSTLYGGTGEGGVVFKLAPPKPPLRAWTETVLYSFTDSGAGIAGGYSPFADLVMDAKGGLYGTTSAGGAGQAGVVFKLASPKPPSLTWTETVLYNFTTCGPGAADSDCPAGGVIMDASGALYGTTTEGGTGQGGVVFKLTPPKWTEKVLHSFANSGPGLAGGGYPAAGVIMDASGALYGTTTSGGTGQGGVVFKLTPPQWTESVLYNFASSGPGLAGGYGPVASVILDSSGVLYGTANFGGAGEGGVVFELH